MGYETTCRARVTENDGRVREAESKVLLETDDLIVRGEARVKIPRASIQRLASRGGVLTITAPNAVVALTLGADAAVTWRKKLEEPPKRLIDKLDVKPDAGVWLIGNHDETLMTQLAERTDDVSRARSATSQDVVFVEIETADHLDRIGRAAAAIKDTGAIWVVHRKGPSGIPDTVIFGKGRPIGLTDVKVARVSDTHTAVKFVRPLALRSKKK